MSGTAAGRGALDACARSPGIDRPLDPVRLRHPLTLRASSCGNLLATTIVGPGWRETRVLDRQLRTVVTLPGVDGALWLGSELWWTSAGSLRKLVPGVGEAEYVLDVDGELLAVAGERLLLGDRRTLQLYSPHHVMATLELPTRLGAPVVSTDGAFVATRFVVAPDTSGVALHDSSGRLLWSHARAGWCSISQSFAGDGQLVVTSMSRDSCVREIAVHEADTGEPKVLLREESERGFVRMPGAVAAGGTVAWLRYRDGWPLLHIYDLATGEEHAVNPGPHEDMSHVDDAPRFSPDGRLLAFNSSRGNLRERRLHVYSVGDGTTHCVSNAGGTSGLKEWLGNDRLVFVQTGPERPAEIHAVGLTGTEHDAASLPSPRHNAARARRPHHRAAGQPDPENHAAVRLNDIRGVAPKHLRLPGGAPADLYLPIRAEASPGPGIVYVHGGVFRQMVNGFHPTYPYSLLHVLNQLLVAAGYVVLSVDYRGSTGYGLEFEQANWRSAGSADVADCVDAAKWLATRPYVDPRRIGVWGLSWGGTMVLHCLARHAELFRAGVSIAGIWDYAQRANFWRDLQDGQPIYFDGRMGHPHEHGDSSWHHGASARNYRDGFHGPLLSLHGTADESVDHGQQELLTRDLAGLRAETVSYLGEGHVFAGADTWRDASRRILEFFGTEL